MQSKVFGLAANPFERTGYRLLLVGAVIGAVGLVMESSLFLSFGMGYAPMLGVPYAVWYFVSGIGYIVQAVGFLFAFLGIALLHRPRR